jgi:threonine dehydrogenase-like Zn-dependent dehydrogenase
LLKQKDHLIMNTNRRSFLQTAAAAAAATYLPNWYLNELAHSAAAATVADDKPAIALIGCGGMGRGDARNAGRFGRIVAVCDVDDSQLAEAKKLWPDAET